MGWKTKPPPNVANVSGAKSHGRVDDYEPS
jgi:hypothetical protein